MQQVPEEALVYSVREVLCRPQILSTNRHIMQGLMELHDICWKDGVLSGLADVIGGEDFKIVIACNGSEPRELEVEGASGELIKGDDNALAEIVLISQTNKRVRWLLHFNNH